MQAETRVDTGFRPVAMLTFSRILAFGITFLVPVILVRLLSQTEFGTYKQIFLVYTTVYAAAQLGMSESLYYFLPQRIGSGGRCVANAFALLSTVGLASLLLIGVHRERIAGWLSNPSLAGHLELAAWYLFLTLASAMLETVLVSRKRYGVAAVTYAGSDVVRAVFLISAVLVTARLDALLWSVVAFAAFRLAFTVGCLLREFGREFRPDLTLLRRQLAYALPLHAAALIDLAQANFHLFAVSHSFDAAVFAIYAVGCQRIPLVDFVSGPAANVMMVRMGEHLRQEQGAFAAAIWRDTTLRLALVFFPLTALLVITAPELIHLLFTSAYAGSVPVFVVWSAATVLGVFQTDAVLRVFAQTRWLFARNIARLLITVALFKPLISAFGLPGAALATVLGILAGKVADLWVMRSLLHAGWLRLASCRDLGAVAAATSVAVLTALFFRGWFDTTVARLLTSVAVFGGSYLCLIAAMGLLPAELRWARRTGVVESCAELRES